MPLCLVLSLLTMLSACDGAPGGDGLASVTEPESVSQARRVFRTSFDDLYLARLQAEVGTKPVQNILSEESGWPSLKWRDLLREIYSESNDSLLLTEDGQPNDVALAFLTHASSANRHDLSAAKYVRPAIANRVRIAEELLAACRQLEVPVLDEQASAVVDTALEAAEEAHPADVSLFIWRRLLSDERSSDIAETFRAQIQLRRACRGSVAALDVVLADALIDYVFDVRGFNWLRVNPDADSEEQRAIVREETKRLFSEIVSSSSRDDATASLEALFPWHPQYERLLEARAEFQRIIADGGFGEPIAERALARGSQGEVVRQLKERLAAEGYFSGEINETFGRSLEDAIRKYQETHQFDPTGRTTRGLWASINTPAEDRLEQINLTIQRWRESRTLDEDYFVHVNIPDFHAELWKDRELVRRFRIVVGNRQRECRDGRMRYVNATPVQSAEMTYVVLNPYWNVPRRILEEELLPQQAEDPTFFETRGYETQTLENGYVLVRQKPGEENALGRVKFMFPNIHDTYMHDTPRRQYFEYPVRAFSHGCMRVHEPMGLLETILELDGQWDAAEIERIQEHGRERRMSLRTPIAVHSEYFVVRVDEEGFVHFNADVYRLDRERLDPRYVREEDCAGAVGEGPAYVLTEEGEVKVRDAEGNLVSPEELEEGTEEGEGGVENGVEGEGSEQGGLGADAAPDGEQSPTALPMDFGP